MKWKLLLLFAYVLHSSANTCRRELTYHQTYGYGYVITCDDINLDEFLGISVYNEITLTIVNSNVSLSSPIFKNLVKIKELNVTDSTVSFTGETALGSLEHLQTLSLINDGLTQLQQNVLSGLGNLKTLNLQHNLLTGFKQGTFKQLRICLLDVSHNKVVNVQDLQLCELSRLETLVLNYNQIVSIGNNTLACLGNLRRLHLDHNQLKTLDTFLSVTVTELHFRYNFINYVNYINASNLERLDLEGNKISRIDANNFMELHNMTCLSLKKNEITYIDSLTFQSNNKLKDLNLEDNSLTWIYLQIQSLEKLNLSGNQLHTIRTANLTHLTSLSVIDLSNNLIDDIEPDAFSSIHSLREINLSGNRLTGVNFVFVTKCWLKDLNLSHNNITTLASSSFKQLKRLRELDLSYNNLQSLNDSVYTPLVDLEVLNMSYNKLTNLDYEVLDPLENLRVLDIEGNNLENIDYSLIINELPSLDVINVKNNLLSCEFLSKMMRYFRENGINFTINENLEYDKENVGGIYCKETENKLSGLQDANALMLNNTKLLKELYNISKSKSESKYKNYGVVLAVLVPLFCLMLAATVAYKYYIWTKRKHYLIDEVELITSDAYKGFQRFN